MIRILLTLVIINVWSLSGQEQTERYQRAKIHYQGRSLAQLDQLGIPMAHGIHKQGQFIISEFSESELSHARAAGFTVEVLIEDAKAHFLAQNALDQPPKRALSNSCNSANENYETPSAFNLGSMGGYFTYQETLDILDAMKQAYPNLITTKADISNFVTQGQPDNSTTPPIGGNGIKWVKISDNPDINEGEPQILYSAIHHAREPASLSQLIFYMWYLLENYETDPEVQSIVNNTELYFVPVVNPDGYLFNEKTDPNGGGFWRKNRRGGFGVDNNRNYDYHVGGDPAAGIWGGVGASNNPNSETYCGTSPFSEAENLAMKWFVENHDFVMAFNNHTSGDLLLYPYGYTNNIISPDDALFQDVSQELVSRNGFDNIMSAGLYPAAGDSDDFMYGTVGTHNSIYAFTPEIGPSFWPPASEIESICRGMMYLNLTAAKMVNNYGVLAEQSPQLIGANYTFDTDFSLKRLGLSGTGNFTISAQPISPEIIDAGPSVSFDAMTPLEERTGSISLELDPNTPEGTALVYDLVVDNGSFLTSAIITKIFGSNEVVFADPGNSTNSQFDNNGWATTTSTFVSPSSCITDSPTGNYSNNTNKTIALLDEIDLTEALAANATFYAKWEIENNWDYVQFEASTDAGATWIALCGRYTNTASSNGFQPLDEPVYDGTQSDWIFEEVNLTDYIGQEIVVRFQLRTDGSGRADGFYFDDLNINVVVDSQLAIASNLMEQVSLTPNPVLDVFTLRTDLTDYQMQVYSLQGQVLLTKTSCNGSTLVAVSKLATGIYFVGIQKGNMRHTIKLIKA